MCFKVIDSERDGLKAKVEEVELVLEDEDMLFYFLWRVVMHSATLLNNILSLVTFFFSSFT